MLTIAQYCIFSEKINKYLLLYISLFIGIPLTSIFYYFVVNGSEPYGGFILINGYVIVLLCLPLTIFRIDFFNIAIKILNLMSIFVLTIFILRFTSTAVYDAVINLLEIYGVAAIGERVYLNVVVNQLYFVVSPLLAIPLAKYSYDCIYIKPLNKTSTLLFLLNFIALILCGTRGNWILASTIPAFIYLKKFDLKYIVTGLIILVSIYLIDFENVIQNLIVNLTSVDEVSNSIKIGFIDDYMKIFDNLRTILFGQGLGSYYYWNSRGYSFYITELTYFEIVRNFGIILGSIMMYLILLPLVKYKQMNGRNKAFVKGYALYIFISFFNPLIFSSVGMLYLIPLISNIYMANNKINYV